MAEEKKNDGGAAMEHYNTVDDDLTKSAEVKEEVVASVALGKHSG